MLINFYIFFIKISCLGSNLFFFEKGTTSKVPTQVLSCEHYEFLRTPILKNICKRLFLHVVFNGNVEQHLLAKLDEMGQDIIVLYLSVSFWCYCISDSNRKRQQSNYEIKVSTIFWARKCFISGNKLRFLIQAMNGNQKFLYAK